MKNILIITLAFTVIMIANSCTQSPTNSEISSYNPQGITLPPQPSAIIIVDKNGKQYETGIEDKTLEDGKKISQKIQECIENARNHGDFVSCMAHLTNWLMKKGYITNKEKGILMNIAARADIP
ncbi:MAG: hypothetical protein N2560_02275 [Ignavibacteria bacterium]|nr:hypothetical protein [Ignavibacteria bacterium]